MTPSSTLRKHFLGAVLVGLSLRLFFIWHFPFETPDSRFYEELARNWLDHGVYGLFVSGTLVPVDVRVPGYPAFLAAIYGLFGGKRLAVLLAQAVLDIGTCFLIAALAAKLASGPSKNRRTTAALWLAATCPFLANYTAVPLTEILATFLTALALLVLLIAYQRSDLTFDRAGRLGGLAGRWILGGFLVGLGTLVRSETPLLLVAVALILAVRWWRPVDWPRLIRTGLLLGVGLALPLIPWAARNWLTLHRIQFLAPGHAEMPGDYVPDGFYAWTKTWLVRFRDVYLAPWKLLEEPIRIESLPSSAFDSAEERARVAALLEQYNRDLVISPALDEEFARLARERAARHPLRTYAWIPLERAATLWFTPRIELLPYSGRLWPLGQRWEEDYVDFLVTVGFGLLNFVYLPLALVGAWRWRRTPGVPLLIAFILVRTAFFTRYDTPEPRYLLVCFPALLALGALPWVRTQR